MQKTKKKKFSVTLFRKVENHEPFRAKIVFDEEIAFHLSVESKDIALEFVGAKPAWSERSQLQRTVQSHCVFYAEKRFWSVLFYPKNLRHLWCT